MLEKMIEDVERFQIEILDYPIPEEPKALTRKQVDATFDHLTEELNELVASKGNIHNQADALMDFIYVALGNLVKMGLAPEPIFQTVHRANMQKKRGDVAKRPNNEGYDAVKPVGWTPPDFHSYLVTKDQLDSVREMSPIFTYLTQLRKNKGGDYNAEDIMIDDYFPFQEESYVQMIYLKALRMVALCKKARVGGEPNYEGLPGSLVDILNYATFFGEWMIEHGFLDSTIIQTDREKEVQL